MYFAIDPSDIAALQEELQSWANALMPGENLFALVDTAFDHGKTPLSWPTEPLALYHSDAMLPLRGVSPVLLPLATDSEVLLQDIRRLASHCRGRPMLSFLQTSLTAEALRDYWQDYISVGTDDGQHFMLRLADTRVLPALAKTLQPASWAQLTAPLDRWLIVNRIGKPEWLPQAVNPRPDALSDQPIVLNDVELTGLIHSSQPDAVIQALEEHFPDLLPPKNRWDFYQRIEKTCDMAARHGVEDFPDLVALAVAVCLSNGELLDDARLVFLLQEKRWDGGELGDHLSALLPEETL